MDLTLIALKLLTLLLVIAIGYVGGRMRWLGDANAARVLGHAAFYIFVPALLFRTTARIDFAMLPWRTVALFFGPAIAMMAAVCLWQRRRVPLVDDAAAAAPGVRGVSAVFGNSVQMGIPMAAAMFGEAGLSIHIAIVSLHSLVLLTLATVFTEIDLARGRARRAQTPTHRGRMLLSTAKAALVHPVTLPILAGLAWNLTGWPLPSVADELLSLLGQAVVPLCLVLIGLSLAMFGIKGSAIEAVKLSALKLLVLPLLVLAVSHGLFGLSGLPLWVLVMAAALPTGNNAILMAQRYDSREAEATTTVVLSTFAFAVTAPAWLLFVRWLAP